MQMNDPQIGFVAADARNRRALRITRRWRLRGQLRCAEGRQIQSLLFMKIDVAAC